MAKNRFEFNTIGAGSAKIRFNTNLLDLGKSENTAEAYLRDAKLFLAWYRDSFGDEPKLLYRANILEYISYMRNIRG